MPFRSPGNPDTHGGKCCWYNTATTIHVDESGWWSTARNVVSLTYSLFLPRCKVSGNAILGETEEMRGRLAISKLPDTAFVVRIRRIREDAGPTAAGPNSTALRQPRRLHDEHHRSALQPANVRTQQTPFSYRLLCYGLQQFTSRADISASSSFLIVGLVEAKF